MSSKQSLRRRSSCLMRRPSSPRLGRLSIWSTSSSSVSYATSSAGSLEAALAQESAEPPGRATEPCSHIERYLRAPFNIEPEMAGPLLQFPLDLYLRMRQEGGNVLLSPWYLSCMLVMMYHGSGGATRRQIARVLHSDDDGEIVVRFDCHATHLFCRDFHKTRHTHSGLMVTSYTGLYHDARVSVSNDFKDPLSSLDMHVHIQDFAESPEQSRLAMDGFLRALTGFCFERDVFAGDSIDLDTFVVLASVFCFGSRWFAAEGAKCSMGEFHPENTSDSQGGDCVQVLTMRGPFQFAQFKGGDAFEGIVLDIPYQDPRRSLAIFIPAPSTNLAALERNLNAAVILTCLSRLEQRGLVEVTFPKMKVKCLTDLKHYLPPMGAVDAFTDSADFVNIARIVGLRVSAAKHLAVFRAGHRGPKTEVEAVPKRSICSTTGKCVLKLTVDRPFLFMVLARDPDTVLLLGSFTHVP